MRNTAEGIQPKTRGSKTQRRGQRFLKQNRRKDNQETQKDPKTNTETKQDIKHKA